MKKLLTTLIASLVLLLAVPGCKIEPEQVKVIAQNAGLFSAVSWIAMDNPERAEIDAVKSLLVIIEEKSADVQAGATYTEVVLPEVLKVIDKDIDPQYRPICKAGAISLLGALDMLFATHPEWKKSQDQAIEVVNAFILGAKSGLSLAETDPLMIHARGMAASRAKVLK